LVNLGRVRWVLLSSVFGAAIGVALLVGIPSRSGPSGAMASLLAAEIAVLVVQVIGIRLGVSRLRSLSDIPGSHLCLKRIPSTPTGE
jgi:hypothetical protein